MAMRDDGIDDFGDLYADLDVQVSTGIPCNGKVAGEPKLEPSDRKCEEDGLMLELDNWESSDSDDDLQIVLNDEKCGGDEEEVNEGDANMLNMNVADDRGETAVGVKRHAGIVGSSYPRNMRTFGKQEWDEAEMSQAEGVASLTGRIPAADQICFSYSLPRNRTIFDINIDAFERKPWRYPGVDVADFFNFGFDEEGWKRYSKSLDDYRHQTIMATKFPDDCSNLQIQSGTTSRVQKNAERRGKEFVMKKGRAIQVEDGDGERIPSADIRRPRAQHSDVVIQIATEELGELVSFSDIKDEEHLNEQGCAASIRQESTCLFYKGRLSQDHDMKVFGGRTPASANKEALEEVKFSLQSKTGDKVCDSISNGLEAESASHEHIQLSLSNTDSHSEDSIGVRSVEQPHESFCFPTSVVEEHSDDDDVHRNGRSRGNLGVRDASERSASFDDDCKDSYPCRKYWKEEYLKEFRCSRKSNYMTGSYDGVGDKSTSKKWNTEKWTSHDDCHHFSTKDVSEGNYSGRELEEKECWLRERAGIRSSDKIEKYLDRTGGVYTTRDVARERSNHLMSEHKYFEKRRDSYIQHKREEFYVNVDDIYNERSARHRYKEEFDQEVRGRCISCRSRDLDVYDFEVGRYPVGESRNLDVREKYDRDPCFALDKRSKIAEYDAKSWRHLDGRRSGYDAYKENRLCYGKEWCYSESNLHQRARKRHDQSRWRGSVRTSEVRDGYCVSNKEYHHDPYSRNTHEFEFDRFSEEEFVCSNRSLNHKRNFKLLDRERVFVDDKVNSWHKDRSNQSSLLGFSYNKKSFSHGKAFIKCDRSGGHVYPSFHDDINKLSAEELVHFVSKDNSASISGKYEKDVHDEVGMHFNGWKSEFPRRRHKLTSGSEGYSGTEKGLTKHNKVLMIDDELYTKNEISVHKLKVGAVEVSNYFEKERRRDGKLEPLGNALKINGDGRQQNPGNHEDGELEEGELIEEPPSSMQEIIPDKRMRKAGRKTTSQTIQSSGSNGLEEKNVQSEDSALPCKLAGKYDDSHILEALAKMQKRKERFDNPIAPKADLKSDLSLQIVNEVEVGEAKHQRPARKRRWGGS